MFCQYLPVHVSYRLIVLYIVHALIYHYLYPVEPATTDCIRSESKFVYR